MARKNERKFVGEEVVVFYNDTPEHVTASVGVLEYIDNMQIILNNDGKITIIPFAKVVRIEPKINKPTMEEKDGE
jgi:hypothetical protein